MTNKTTTQETGFFNADDYSGEEINVAYTVSEDGIIAFEMYGYRFEISKLTICGGSSVGPIGYRELHGSEWNDALKTLFCDDDTDKNAVIAAARYVRNFV